MAQLIIKPFIPEWLPDEYCKYLAITFDDYKCLKVSNICEILGKNKNYVYWLIKSGQLRIIKIDTNYRVMKFDLYKYLNNIDSNIHIVNIDQVNWLKKYSKIPSNFILKTNQAAIMLHTTRKKVIHLFETGEIKAFRHNKNGPWYTTFGDVERYYYSIFGFLDDNYTFY